MSLKNKKILLGITGSIAAYKAAYLTRLLIREGAEVQVILTPYAKEFITPLTLSTLSQKEVLCDFFRREETNDFFYRRGKKFLFSFCQFPESFHGKFSKIPDGQKP